MSAAPPVAVGEEIPGLEIVADLGVAIRTAAMQWAFPAFLYDEAAAQAAGMPGPMLTPESKLCLMARAVEEWLAGRGYIARARAAHRRPVVVGDHLRVVGTVVAVGEREDGAVTADLEVYLIGPDGAPASRGFAAVVLW